MPQHMTAPDPLRTNELTRDGLAAAIQRAWDLTDWLYSGLVDDAALAEQPDPLRNPLIFYPGHSAAFYLNKLQLAGLIDRPIDERLQRILAVGVDPAAPGDLDLSTRYPSAARMRVFRSDALDVVLDAVSRCDISRAGWNDPTWSLLMGLEHDLIHFETSSVLIRQLPIHRVAPPMHWTLAATSGITPDNPEINLDGGPITLGKPLDFPTYGWDNEYGERRQDVPPLRVSAQLVSNGEFLEFVEDGGYEQSRWWTDQAWAWRNDSDVRRPRFWDDGDLRTVFSCIALPLDWPVEVCRYEAQAYCAWVGARLPTEAEHAHIAEDAARLHGDAGFHPAHHLHLASCSPRSVDAGEPTPRGVHDAHGNVWQWLADDFHPLPGFRTHPWYSDFSDLYFGEDHGVLHGGSWASMGTGASQFYRLWFRPYFYQHAGFRLVWTLNR